MGRADIELQAAGHQNVTDLGQPLAQLLALAGRVAVFGTSTSSQITTSAREPVTLAVMPRASSDGSRWVKGRRTVN